MTARLIFLSAISIWLSVIQPVRLAAQEDDTKQDRNKRAEFMESLFLEFKLKSVSESDLDIAARREAILRWSNPIRNSFSDGMSFLWTNQERPVAVATISIRGDGNVYYELASLSAETLDCRFDDNAVWKPAEATNFIGRTVPFDQQLGGTNRIRELQFRRIAREFHVDMVGDPKDPPDTLKRLRLLDQPVYTWSEPGSDQLVGAMFAFCEGTDPEAFLVLKATAAKPSGVAAIEFSLARVTSRPLSVYHDDKLVIDIENYWRTPRSIDAAYMTRELGPYTKK